MVLNAVPPENTTTCGALLCAPPSMSSIDRRDGIMSGPVSGSDGIEAWPLLTAACVGTAPSGTPAPLPLLLLDAADVSSASLLESKAPSACALLPASLASVLDSACPAAATASSASPSAMPQLDDTTQRMYSQATTVPAHWKCNELATLRCFHTTTTNHLTSGTPRHTDNVQRMPSLGHHAPELLMRLLVDMFVLPAPLLLPDKRELVGRVVCLKPEQTIG